MNKLGKMGAALAIVGFFIEFIGSIITFATFGFLSFVPIFGPFLMILAVIVLGLSIAGIVLSILALTKKSNLRIASGVIALVSVICFGWATGLVFWILSGILLIASAILLFCGKQKASIVESDMITETETIKVFQTNKEK